jgi:hypothetical protein
MMVWIVVRVMQMTMINYSKCDNYFARPALIVFSHIYSGLQKHCNVLQFRIVCSVALYGMEITLSIIERKYSTPFWLSN